MKVKILTRNPDEYLRETKRDIHKRTYNITCEHNLYNSIHKACGKN